MEESKIIEYILDLLKKLHLGEYSTRGEIFEEQSPYNDVIIGINNLAERLNHLYDTGRCFETKINEILDVIVSYSTRQFNKEITLNARHNMLYPVVKGLNILGRELAESTVEKMNYDSLISALPDMLILIDEKGVIKQCNDIACTILGYSEAQLLGKHIEEIFREGHLLFQGGMKDKLLADGAILNLDKIFLTKDRDRIPVSFSAAVIKDKVNNIRGMVCFAHDMTLYKRNEKILNLRMKQLAEARSAALNMMEDAYEANRTKTTFLTNMSHELRTPMSAIIGISQIIASQSENLTEEQKEGLGIIHDSGKRLLALINDILDLSRIEVGKMEVETTRFLVFDLVTNLEKIIQNLIEDKDIKIYTQIDSRVPEYLIADEKKLNQILLNILGNSAKFTKKGLITLKVYLQDDKLYFEVIDTGIGIEKKNLQHIFDEFKQLDGSMSRKYEGTGLGLSLCKKILHLMKGDITVESRIGKGTTMRFFIPLIEESPAADYHRGLEAENHKTESLSYEARKDKPLILIADDEDICQFTLKIMLKQHYDLAFVKNGKEAVEKYFMLRPKVVLMDIMMPVLDGYSALKTIRERETEDSIPIIAVTARALDNDRDRILNFGFDEYIAKPFDAKVLQNLIKKFIN